MGIDLTDEQTSKRMVLVVAVLLVVLVAFLLHLLTDGGDSDGDAPAEASSSEVASPPATSTGGSTDETTGGATQDPSQQPTAAATDEGAPTSATRVARKAVLAMSEFSWQDSGHLAFLDALKPYATDDVIHAYQDTFGHDEVLDHQWQAEIVVTKTDQKAEIVSVTTQGESPDGWVLLVDYTTQRRTDGGAWGEHAEVRLIVTVAKTSGGWKVVAVPEVEGQAS